KFDFELNRTSALWRPLGGWAPGPAAEAPRSLPFVKVTQGKKIGSLQQPADFAVVIPTILRPTIVHTVQSVFNQRLDGTIQILIGIDELGGDASLIDGLCR